MRGNRAITLRDNAGFGLGHILEGDGHVMGIGVQDARGIDNERNVPFPEKEITLLAQRPRFGGDAGGCGLLIAVCRAR